MRVYGITWFYLKQLIGGEGGIRTHGWVAPSLDFESSTFDHSATSPCAGRNYTELNLRLRPRPQLSGRLGMVPGNPGKGLGNA